MKAVLLTEPTEAKNIVLRQCAIPEVKPGWVLVRIMAFGLNHSEQILRQSEITAPYIKKPIIPGIECVGEIADASDSHFSVGEKVVALMGGMGRSFNGSYATYFTAWGSLFECLHLKPDDTLLIRGATCALGYAAIQLAKAFGCKVLATTHRESKLHLLEQAGVDLPLLDTGSLKGKIAGVTKALELVGPKTLMDTLNCIEKGVIVCQTGVLGGIYSLNNFDPIKDIPNGVFLTGFYSNMPTQDVMDDIFDYLNIYHLLPGIGKVYPFSQIAKACEDMDAGRVNGKIVIKLDE
ncbi:MAG: NADPH:quinone reductase and related Zn-dependent oxidoreductase [Firmicutes bacterium]|nr:NADPH:quinone reductase and related Zn-dependent oxidoreductase [Bacillota bacterium]